MKRAGILAAVIIVSLFLGLTVYSGVWPPFTIVSSGSMQHSDSWVPGVITTGDMVYLKSVDSNANVITYVNGSETGFKSFGEYGSVIIYDYGGHQIIHRAMFYLGWNGNYPIVYGYANQPWIKISSSSVTLEDIGYAGKNLILNLDPIRRMPGFITCGDFNLGNSTLNPSPVADQDQVLGFFDPPVKFNEIVGVAVFDIPWVGLIKLWPMWELHFASPENPAPSESYIFLVIIISIVAVMAASPEIFSYVRKRDKEKKR